MAPSGQAFYFRDLAAGQTAWQHGDNLNVNAKADLTFWLYGTVTGPATISGLSTGTFARSGYLEIFGAEIVFGPNGSRQQLYFYANDHLRAVGLDGNSVFTIAGGLAQLRPGLQPVVAPDGSVHTVLSAYAPNGSLLWVFPTPYPYNVFTPADIDSAGSHYFVQNLSQLFALNPDGSQRWHVAVADYLDGRSSIRRRAN
jgi:hypothetical protein